MPVLARGRQRGLGATQDWTPPAMKFRSGMQFLLATGGNPPRSMCLRPRRTNSASRHLLSSYAWKAPGSITAENVATSRFLVARKPAAKHELVARGQQDSERQRVDAHALDGRDNTRPTRRGKRRRGRLTRAGIARGGDAIVPDGRNLAHLHKPEVRCGRLPVWLVLCDPEIARATCGVLAAGVRDDPRRTPRCVPK